MSGQTGVGLRVRDEEEGAWDLGGEDGGRGEESWGLAEEEEADRDAIMLKVV